MDETLETFGENKLKIFQKKRGYRFSADAILLSEFVSIRRDEKAIDLGTGCGILPLLLSQTTKGRSFLGVEVQKTLSDLAERNVMLNHLQGRIRILREDYRTLPRIFPAGSFHVAVSNPPYRKFHSGRVNPSQERAIARHEIYGAIDDLVSVAAYLLPPKGRFYLIFPASRAVDVIAGLRQNMLEPKRIRFVHPYAGAGAKFILVESVKDSGVELKIMAPLILRRPRGPRRHLRLHADHNQKPFDIAS
jgi:tRNA1Val (adenine37-N6)-methyltransferase